MRFLRVLSPLLALVAAAPLLSAQSVWTGAVSTNWDNPFNWSTGQVPGSSDNAVIAPAANQPSSYIFGPICDDLSIQSGATLTLSAGFDLDVLGALTIDGTLTVSSSSSDIVVEEGWTNNGTFSGGGATVELTGDGVLAGSSLTQFAQLVLVGGTRSATANFAVDEDMTIDNGAVLDIGAGVTVTASANWSSSALGASTTGSGTVRFDGNGTVTTGLNGLPNVEVVSGTRSVNASTVSGDLTMTGGTLLVLDNATLIVLGDVDLSGGTLSFQSFFPGNETLDARGNATIQATAGTFADDARILCAGDWSSTSAFSPSAGSVELNGAGTRTLGGSSPTFFNLFIDSGTVTQDVAAFVLGSLVIDTGATLDSNATLDLEGDVALGGPSASWDLGGVVQKVSGDWISAGGSAVGGSVEFDGDGVVNTGGGTLDSVEQSSGLRTVAALDVLGDLTLSGGELLITEGITANVAGNALLSGGVLSFEDGGGQFDILDIDGDVAISGTTAGTFSPSSQIKCAGDWVHGASFAPLAGAVHLDGSTVATVSGAPLTLSNLRIISGVKTIAGAGILLGDLRIDDGVSFITNGALAISGFVSLGNATASWDLGGESHIVGGNWTSTGASVSNGTIEFLSDGDLDLGGGTIGDVLISGGVRTAFTGTVLGNLTMTGGTLLITQDQSLSVGGDAVMTGGTLSWFATAGGPDEELRVAGDVLCNVAIGDETVGSSFFCGGNWQSDGSFLPERASVHLDGPSPTTVTGSPSFEFLIITESQRTLTGSTTITGELSILDSGTLIAGAPIDVNGSVVMDSTAVFDLGAFNHTVAVDWTSGGGTTIGSGTVEFDGTGTLDTGAAGSLSNVLISAGIRSVLTSVISQSLEMTSGTLNILNDQVLTVGGDADLTGGVLSFTGGGGTFETLDVDGDLTLSAVAGTMSADSLILCSGDWASTGNWAPTSGTVFLDGGTQTTIDGVDNKFFDLVVFDGVKIANGPITAGGDLTVFDSQTLVTFAPVEVLGNVVLVPSATWALGQLTHTIHGNWTSSGATVQNSGVIEFVADGFLSTGTSPVPNVRIVSGARGIRDSNIRFNLEMTGGVLIMEDNQSVTVQGNANLFGGILAFEDLSAGDETMLIEGNAGFAAASGGTSANSRVVVNGNWSSVSTWSPASGIVVLDPSSSMVTIGGVDPVFATLEVADDEVVVLVPTTVQQELIVQSGAMLTGQATLDVNGDVTLGDSTAAFDVTNQTHTVAGDWTSAGASATGTGAIELDDAGAMDTGGGTLPDLVISGGPRSFLDTEVLGDVDMTAGSIAVLDDQTFQVAGDATLTGGTVSFVPGAAGNEVIDVDGDVTITGAVSGATSAEAFFFCGGDWASDASYVPTAGTVVLDGFGSSTVGGSGLTLPNLDITGGQKTLTDDATMLGLNLVSGASLDANGAMDVDGDVTLGDGTAQLDLGGLDHRVLGDWISSGADGVNGTVEFDGNGTLDTGSGSIGSCLVTAGVRVANTSTIEGDLGLSGGTLRIFDDQTLTVEGNAGLTGGTLTWSQTAGGSDEVLDVAGDVLCVAAAGNTTANSVFRCGGAWASNSTFSMPSGTVELDGSSATLISGAEPTFDPTFPALRIRNSTRSAANDLALSATQVTVDNGGGLDVTGVALTLDTPLVTVNGGLSVGDDGVLALPLSTFVVVTGTGSFAAVGSFGAPAVVTGVGGGGYLFEVGGDFDATHFRFEQMGAGGIVINEGATLLSFVAGVFAQPSSTVGSILLDIRRPLGSDTEIRYVDFEDPAGVGTTNVRTLGSAQLTFVESGGDFSGPGFEFDPLGLIEWTNDPTVVDFSATPGADLVNLDWTSTQEADTVQWIVERATDAGGPYAEVATVQAVGPSTYGFVDNGVLAQTEYFYRLVERKAFGQELVLAMTDATPWGAGLPPNVLTVGPGGAFADIQSAVDAANFFAAVVSVAPGTYPAFTFNGGVGTTVRIYGDGTGPVMIDTTAAPVTIQNMTLADSVEISDLTIGDPGSPNPGVLIQSCSGPVILDELVIHGGVAQPGLRLTASSQVAVQRCDIDGDPGMLAEVGSTAVVGRGSLDEVTVVGSSNVRLAQTSPFETVDGSSTLINLPGIHADIDAPEFVQMDSTFPTVLDGEVGGIYALAFSGTMLWLDIRGPSWEMVGLIGITGAPPAAQGVLTGPTPLTLPVPADGVLYGFPIPLQMIVISPTTNKFRWSNVATFVPISN
ncbi:MAG: hypothetical protein AAF682_30505 [Planctomycetota bacterium]